MGSGVRPEPLPPNLGELLARLMGKSPPVGVMPPAVVNASGMRTPEFDRLFTPGGYADSLMAAMGKPQRGVTLADLAPGLGGVATTGLGPGSDKVELSHGLFGLVPSFDPKLKERRSPADKEHPEWLLSHELAHLYEDRRIPSQVLQRFKAIGLRRIPDDIYANRNGHEHFAQAVANVTDVLRNTTAFDPANKDQEAILLKVLEARELDTPGFAVLLDDLLDKKIYSKHPLKPVLKKWATDTYQRQLRQNEKLDRRRAEADSLFQEELKREKAKEDSLVADAKKRARARSGG